MMRWREKRKRKKVDVEEIEEKGKDERRIRKEVRVAELESKVRNEIQ